MNLKIDAVGDCRLKLIGSYVKNSGQCSYGFTSTETTIEIDGSGPDKIVLKNFPGNEPTSATVNCENKTINIPEFYAGIYKAKGTGTFANGIITLQMHFGSSSGPNPPPFDCTATLIKN